MSSMTLINHLTKIPIGVASVALGTAGITGAWTAVLGNSIIGIIGAGIASILVLVVLSKYIIHPSLLLKELSYPIVGSIIPTLDMAIMLIAATVVKYTPILGKGLWLIAIISHIIFLKSFLYHRLKDFDLTHVVPSWFVPPVGIVVAAVSGAEMGFSNFSIGLFYFGLYAYLLLLPLMFYRLLFGDKIDDSRLATFGVMGAPANLCLAGYLTAFPNPEYHFATSLAYLGIFTTALVYLSMIKVFRLKFSPLHAAYTFPLGIGATAMIKYKGYLQTTSTPDFVVNIWSTVAWIELFIASTVIFYVFVQLKLFIYKSIKES